MVSSIPVKLLQNKSQKEGSRQSAGGGQEERRACAGPRPLSPGRKPVAGGPRRCGGQGSRTQQRAAERDGGQNPQDRRRTVPPSDGEGPAWLSSRGRMGSASSEALPLAAGWEASRLTGSPSPDGMEHGREAGCPAQAPVTSRTADVLSARPLAALSLGT